MFQPRFWPSVQSVACEKDRSINALRKRACNRSELIKARPAQRSYIVLALGFVDRHLAFHPGQRDVGLHTANLLDHGLGKIVVARHGGRSSEQSIGADEISTLTDRFAR